MGGAPQTATPRHGQQRAVTAVAQAIGLAAAAAVGRPAPEQLEAAARSAGARERREPFGARALALALT